jgi:hypothetical protein
MPIMNGVQATRAIDAVLPGICVIGLSRDDCSTSPPWQGGPPGAWERGASSSRSPRKALLKRAAGHQFQGDPIPRAGQLGHASEKLELPGPQVRDPAAKIGASRANQPRATIHRS